MLEVDMKSNLISSSSLGVVIANFNRGYYFYVEKELAIIRSQPLVDFKSAIG